MKQSSSTTLSLNVYIVIFQTEELRTLDDIIASHPEKKESVLGNMKQNLTLLVSKYARELSLNIETA